VIREPVRLELVRVMSAGEDLSARYHQASRQGGSEVGGSLRLRKVRRLARVSRVNLDVATEVGVIAGLAKA
jgi:hypothetical protein